MPQFARRHPDAVEMPVVQVAEMMVETVVDGTDDVDHLVSTATNGPVLSHPAPADK